MRYIEKDYSTEVVRTYNLELQSQFLDETSLQNPSVYPGQTGRKLFRLVRDIKVIPHFWDLKHQMMYEQGGICCYCGLKISFDEGRKATVEHLIPKGVCRELVGEYKNLLLCCSLTADEENETREGIVTAANQKHCDDTKGNVSLNYTPLQLDCGSRFSYDITGHIHETDEKSAIDIRTLNLDCKALVDRRKNAMEILYDADGAFVTDDELVTISKTIMNRQTDGDLREFCFVVKDVADGFIKEKNRK